MSMVHLGSVNVQHQERHCPSSGFLRVLQGLSLEAALPPTMLEMVFQFDGAVHELPEAIAKREARR